MLDMLRLFELEFDYAQIRVGLDLVSYIILSTTL